MRMLIKSIYFMVIAVCIFIVSSCWWGSTPPPTATPTPTDTPTLIPTSTSTPMPTPTPVPVIRVVPSGALLESTELFVEVHQQDNCDVPTTATSIFQNSETIHYAVELEAGVTVNAEGEISIPGFTKVGVGAAVAAHYNVKYGGQETKTFSLELEAPNDTRVDHTLRHLQIWDTGTIIITILGEDMRFPYRFPRGYRIERKSVELECPTTPVPTTMSISEEVSQTISTSTPTPIPTPTPTLTPTPTPIPIPTPMPTKYSLIEEGEVQPYTSESFDRNLGDKEIIIGRSYGFKGNDKGDTGGCLTFLIQGPGQFKFEVTDGAWLRYSNVTSSQDTETLLESQKNILIQDHSCTEADTNTIRLVSSSTYISPTIPCLAQERGPLIQSDHFLDGPLHIVQLWRANGDSKWGKSEITALVYGDVSIIAAGGNVWTYPTQDCARGAQVDMENSASVRNATIVTADELRAEGLIR